MNSLNDLNGLSATSVTVTDLRPSRVIFDFDLFEDQEINITSTVNNIIPTRSVVDIWNYGTANVRYVVTIVPGTSNPIVGSTVSWLSIPAGLTLAQVGNVYTITGFTKADDWTAVKEFTWTLPANYNTKPLFYLKVSVTWYDSELAQDIERDWFVYDNDYFYNAQLTSSASITCNNLRVKRSAVALTSSCEIECVVGKFKLGRADFTSTTSMTVEGQLTSIATADIISTMTVTATRAKALNATLSSTTSMLARIDFGLFRIEVNNTPTRYQTQITLTHSGPLTVYWGDGTNNYYSSSGTRTIAHNYPTTSTVLRTISLDGNVSQFRVSAIGGSYTAVKRVISWGDTGSLTDLTNGFQGQNELNSVPAYIPSSVTNVSGLFYSCSILNDNRLTYWDTTNITNMNSIFYGAAAFNQAIGVWKTANTTNMGSMFEGATAFNQSLNSWNISNVTNMSSMFSNATAFNQSLNSWNTASVTNMSNMFRGATAFNGNISSWNTANVTNMHYMFGQSNFNSNISSWNTSKVTDMSYMFANNPTFNQNITAWDTSKVTRMEFMFFNASAFGQAIGSWNTGLVTQMNSMFNGATAFNQPIGSWNTVNVTNMASMFRNNSTFNQPIGAWETGNVTLMDSMFENASAFDQNISAWDVHLIATKPSNFDTGTSAGWIEAEKPVWGTYGS